MYRIRQRVALLIVAAALFAADCGADGESLAGGGAAGFASTSPALLRNEVFLSPFASTASCQTLGGNCTLSTDCCSLTCSNGSCVNASGKLGCHADSDVCATSADCCTGQCSIPSGASSGTCVPLSSFGAGICTIDGEPCASSSECCSRICADTPGGGKACQADSGCRVRANLCIADAACCGGAGTGIGSNNGEGHVTCNIVVGTDPGVGTCSNPVGCNSEGDVCGVDANGRNDCCGCAPPSSGCCKADGSGVYRCHGGSTGACPTGYDASNPACCIAAGQICTFSHECCGGAPCVPDQSGVLRCAAASSATGGACTTSLDCSNGLQCVAAPGALGGTCKSPDTIFTSGFD